MKILLLGATGYLGGNIAYKLSQNHDVTCVVRSTSDLSRLEQQDVHLISNEPGELELYFKRKNIDWVINAVCTYKQNDSLYGDMLQSNIIFPLSVLNLAVKYGVKNYITIGTSLPYEFNLYSFTKHQFSNFGKYLSVKDNLNFADLKLEMFYGGLFEPSNRFLSSCRIKMQKNEDVLLTEGYQKRDLVRIEDVVDIIDNLICSEYVKGYKVLPIGSGENHTIREIMSYMKNQIKSNSDLKFGAVESRENEPDTLADISWYKEINYKNIYNFWDGLKEECER